MEKEIFQMQGEGNQHGKRDAREKGVFQPYFKCEVGGEKANQYADSTAKGNAMQGMYFKCKGRAQREGKCDARERLFQSKGWANQYADSAARRETLYKGEAFQMRGWAKSLCRFCSGKGNTMPVRGRGISNATIIMRGEGEINMRILQQERKRDAMERLIQIQGEGAWILRQRGKCDAREVFKCEGRKTRCKKEIISDARGRRADSAATGEMRCKGEVSQMQGEGGMDSTAGRKTRCKGEIFQMRGEGEINHDMWILQREGKRDAREMLFQMRGHQLKGRICGFCNDKGNAMQD